MHSVMRTTEWLRRQVARLEEELQRHSVFESNTPATSEELADLRSTVVIHTYLKQQLLRRETVNSAQVDEEVDTQEFVLVRR